LSKPTLPETVGDGAGGGEEVVWHESRPTFTQLPDWLLAHPEVSDAALRTWLVLASYADRQGEAFPGVRTIATKRGKGRSVIFQHLAQLEAAGALRRRERYRDNGGRTSTLYVIAWAYPLLGEDVLTPPSEKPDGGPSAENRTGPRPKNRTPRTRSTNEQNPLTPSVDNSGPSRSEPLRGGGPPRTPARRSPQKKNPRALGTNPRALAKKAQETQERAEQIERARAGGYRQARLTEQPIWATVEEFREHRLDDARRHLREIDAELLDAEVGGYAAGLASRTSTASSAP
jgi:hypothetical protein